MPGNTTTASTPTLQAGRAKYLDHVGISIYLADHLQLEQDIDSQAFNTLPSWELT